jgi:glycosyltransferase involved in cell wall biosynthesis
MISRVKRGAKKVVIVSTHSFLDRNIRVQMQFLASGIGAHGWLTDYLSILSSPFDILGKRRRQRFFRVWIKRQDKHGFPISSNLREFASRALFPVDRRILRFDWQLKTYPVLLPPRFRTTKYDACIFDATPNAVFLPYIKAKHHIFRLNDLPRGFEFRLHPEIIEILESHMSKKRCSAVWAVSKPLAEYALSLDPGCPVELIPNGVNADPFLQTLQKSDCRSYPQKAVFIGSIEEWFDQELVNKAAQQLPEWTFDFYGPLAVKWLAEAPNVYYRGVLRQEEIPETLGAYSVGLIPFKDLGGLIQVMERPLKFYEYVAGGLGVASTDIGALREGMGKWAVFGNRPHEFAEAVVAARDLAEDMSQEARQEFILENSWNNIIKGIARRLDLIVNDGE